MAPVSANDEGYWTVAVPLRLLDVIDVLDRSRVPYVIVGAIAAAYHGVVRASRDADAVVSLPSADLPALVQRLKVAGFEVEVRKAKNLLPAKPKPTDWLIHNKGGVR